MSDRPCNAWPLTVAARASRARGRETLVKLLDAAEAELAVNGYHGARMAHIARSAGVAHGTLYVYFRDRVDLLGALQQDVDAEVRAVLLAMPSVTPGDAGLRDVGAWTERVCVVFQRHGAVLQALAEALSDDEDSPAGRAALRSMQVTTRHMGARLAEASATSPGFDPEIAGLCLFALIERANRAVFRRELDTPISVLAAEIARFVQRAATP